MTLLIKDALSEALSKHPDNDAVRESKRGKIVSYSYAEFVALIQDAKLWFDKQPEHNFGIATSNTVSGIANVYGAMASGKRICMLDPSLSLNNIADALTKSGATCILCEDSSLVKAIQESEDTQKFNAQPLYKPKVPQSINAQILLEEIEAWNEDGELVFFTSGTTKSSKAALNSFEKVCLASYTIYKLANFDTTCEVYIPAPIHHLYGFNSFAAFLCMGHVCCIGSATRISNDLPKFNAQIGVFVPSYAQYALKRQPGELKKLKHLLLSSAPTPLSVQEGCAELGICAHNVYGSSELGTIAMSLESTDFNLLSYDESKKFYLTDEGELCAISQFAMAGYMEDGKLGIPAAQLFDKDGAYHTGDGASIKSENSFELLGRLDSILVLPNGEKLICADHENALCKLNGVEESAVAFIDGKLTAFIVPTKEIASLGTSTTQEKLQAELDSFNKTQALAFRIVRLVVLEKPLPRTALGKLKRNELPALAK